jgi:hypothetical protein
MRRVLRIKCHNGAFWELKEMSRPLHLCGAPPHFSAFFPEGVAEFLALGTPKTKMPQHSFPLLTL